MTIREPRVDIRTDFSNADRYIWEEHLSGSWVCVTPGGNVAGRLENRLVGAKLLEAVADGLRVDDADERGSRPMSELSE